MILSFPTPPGGAFGSYIAKVLDIIRRAFISVVSSDAPSARVILQSPGGSQYALTVDDTGALAITDAITQHKSAAGTVMGAAQPFLSSAFKLLDPTDQTKAAKFDVSVVATATTRTLTVPNANGTIALTTDVSAAQAAAESYADSVAATAQSNAITTSETYTDTKARRILQIATYETGSAANGTTTVPFDNTIPQNTEGVQFMTLVFTPLSASSTLIIEVIGYYSANGTQNFVQSLFRDSGANALASSVARVDASSAITPLPLRHVMASPGTSSTTFKVRCGGSAALTTYFNSNPSGSLFGGVFASGIKITEYL